MKKIPFTKMHGLGNDFVVINNIAKNIELLTEDIQLIANRNYGIGCDQVLILEAAPFPTVDFGYTIYNADGSTSGQCGNGARCLAKFIQLKKLSDKKQLMVATKNTIMELIQLPDGNVKVNMGTPNFLASSLPLILPQEEKYSISILGHDVSFYAVSMGNPHALILVEDGNEKLLHEWGHALNTHTAFPEGVNVGLMKVSDRRHIKLRVFERGVGETLACGSGACAAMVIARRHQWVEDTVDVALPGGHLTIEWLGGDADPVWMTGSATVVSEGEWFYPQ